MASCALMLRFLFSIAIIIAIMGLKLTWARIDVVVAKDGTGNFKTISEAVKIAPEKSEKRFVIYVKQGVYTENVKIDESKWNLLIFGDGMEKSVVSGNLSNSAGYSIKESPTFAVRGRGFVARNMGFENTAGPAGGQAVAFLSTSDQSVYYNCSMSGYQDTLFTLTGRQFYRECVVSGTVDFIFGDASAVFQRSTIFVRKRDHGNVNYITAHSRNCSQCPGAYSFQSCWVHAGGARTFLGRPWRNYARVVFMESKMDGLIDPEGWSGWGAPIPDTVYYGEYKNWGPASGTSRRAKGVKRSMTDPEAKAFTVRELIGGDKWLPASGVPYQLDF